MFWNNQLPLLKPASRIVLCLALGMITGSLRAAVSGLPAAEAREGWLQLFDGETNFGWIVENGDWRVKDKSLVAGGPSVNQLRTTASFSDFDLKFEARFSGPAALVFRVDPASKPEQPGFRLSLNDGSLGALSKGSPGVTNSGWNTFEITADKESLSAVVNGKKLLDIKNGKNRVGYLEFVSENGAMLELRSIRLKPLDLDTIYNGANLDGWKAVGAPAPQQKSGLKLPGLSHKPKPPKSVAWSGAGVIHGESGIGQLESASAYDDFVLQFLAQAEVAREHEQPSAQMFFRGDAGQFKTGYAVDLVNRKGGKPRANLGAGGLIGLDPSRLPATLDTSNLTATVIARARRLSIWINGLLVTDYYDSRPEGVYRSAAGTLGFRLESETAKLDIGQVRVAVLAKGPQAPPPAPVAAVAAAPATGPGGSTTVLSLPGPSPEDKAKQERVRQLTARALEAKDPADAVQINKQILLIDPTDLAAQQRLDKAQEKLDRAAEEQAKTEQQQHEAESTSQANQRRREGLIQQTQERLIHGDLDGARQALNDAQRLGATGPETDRLNAIIVQRLRHRLLMRIGLAATGFLAFVAVIVFLFRRRNRTLTPYLLTVEGTDKGKRYLLNQDVTHLGAVAIDSGKKNEILIRDPDRMVSRFHCEVHRRGNAFYVIDLDSSNGTFMGSKRLPPGVAVRLRDGRRIGLANAATFELQLERSRQ